MRAAGWILCAAFAAVLLGSLWTALFFAVVALVAAQIERALP